MPTETDQPGIDRRDLLKKAAVAGAVAWSVPAIQTLNMPEALAAVGSPGETCFTVRIDRHGCSSPNRWTKLKTTYPGLWAYDPDLIVNDTTRGCTKVKVLSRDCDRWGTWKVVLADGCYLVAGFTQSGKSFAPANLANGQPAPKGTTGTIYFKPTKRYGCSHIELTICCKPL